MVSEGDGNVNLVSALDAGADDYISKPIVVEEFLARMRAALRRVRIVEVPAAIVTDDFTIDIAARRAFHSDGSEIYLTGVEISNDRDPPSSPRSRRSTQAVLKRSGPAGRRQSELPTRLRQQGPAET